MDTTEIIYLVSFSVCIAALIAVVITLIVKKKKWVNKNTKNAVEKVVVKDGVRYTADQNVVKDNGSMNITHNEGDILLTANRKRVASKTGAIKPGKYVVLSANSNEGKFNLKVGGFVREFKHNSPIVLAEGDEITAISHNVILR
ncbi:MAG: hypothetical protein FWE53_00050 [Firmicutes bacterium]|nr:hypothetical protein [Bacillota bacterium]